MKKIVGIMAAVAVTASVFAVDVAAKMHGWTNLFNYEFTDGAKPSFLGVRDPFDRKFRWSSTGIGFSVAGDQAGASFELDGRNVAVENASVWVKPFDALKIIVGSNGIVSNTETIDYTRLQAYGDKYGWGFDITPVDGLTINTLFVTGDPAPWTYAFWGANGKIGETIAKVTYAADFGSIFGMVNYNDPETILTAGYTGNFDAISIFVDGSFALEAKDLGADFFLSGSADALGYKVYAKYERNLDTSVHSLLAKAMVTYGVGSGTVYCKAYLPNVLASGTFGIQVYPGYQFNIGSASIDAGVQLILKTNEGGDALGTTNSIAVPVIYSIGF